MLLPPSYYATMAHCVGPAAVCVTFAMATTRCTRFLPCYRSIAPHLDPVLLKAWFHTITTMRTELANWTARQSKHAAVAYPLITDLICMEENNTFSQYVDTLVDNLHRQLKVRHASLPLPACFSTHNAPTYMRCRVTLLCSLLANTKLGMHLQQSLYQLSQQPFSCCRGTAA